jgi:hypothetical protein
MEVFLEKAAIEAALWPIAVLARQVRFLLG